MAFHRFIHWALGGEAVHIYGDGTQTRDFTFVRDIVAANIAAGMSDAAGAVFNIGGGSQVSVNTVLAMLEELLERKIDVQYAPNERGDVRHTSADTRLARDVLGYNPQADLLEGLDAELQWLVTEEARSTAIVA